MSPEDFRTIIREEVRGIVGEEVRAIMRDEFMPFVRQEIAAAEARIMADCRAAIAEAEARIMADCRAAIAEAEARSQEFARDIETKLLTAFHGHAKGQTARLHTTEVTIADLSTRIAALEDRMLNLETRRPH